MLSIFFIICFTFLFSSLFGYVVHWALHQSWSGRLNKKHMTHHLVLYPPSDYVSDTYRQAGKDNTVITFIIVSIPLILFPIILGVMGILSLKLVITALSIMGIMGFLHNYLHDSFHIKNHFLNKIPGLKRLFGCWSKLHYLHHVDLQKNFGIFLFYWDRVFKTFWKG